MKLLTRTLLAAIAIQALLVIAIEAQEKSSCNAREVNGNPRKIICVCNETSCDSFNFEWPRTQGHARLIQSSERGKRFETRSNIRLNSRRGERAPVKGRIKVDMTRENQLVLGWGGAFTDSFGYNLRNLSDTLAERLIDSYFGVNGSQYNFGRVPIGGSDFSTHAYSLDDTSEADFELRHWNLTKEDYELKIPYIKMAREMLRENGTNLKLIGSPWSPPKWMKTNDDFVRGSLINSDRVYRSYANYLVKFFEAYRDEGVDFWGATVQNEPITAQNPEFRLNSLEMNNEETIKFISKYYGPALAARGWTKDSFKLMIGDDNLGLINQQVPAVMRDSEASKYIAGLAFHWYTSGDEVPYNALEDLYKMIRHKIEFVIMTEASNESSGSSDKQTDPGSWDRGQAYAVDIIKDFSRHTGAWIDWNMALDVQGGPNWVGNFVDSPILVNASSNEFYKQPMYYALAHFSRFFRPGSIVVDSEVHGAKPDLLTLAAHNKETGHLVINIVNKADKPKEVSLRIRDDNRETYETDAFEVDAKSINSLIVKL